MIDGILGEVRTYAAVMTTVLLLLALLVGIGGGAAASTQGAIWVVGAGVAAIPFVLLGSYVHEHGRRVRDLRSAPGDLWSLVLVVRTGRQLVRAVVVAIGLVLTAWAVLTAGVVLALARGEIG